MVKIEHKVSHEEWDEVTLTPEEFYEIAPLLKDEDGEFWNYTPTLVFEHGTILADESWNYKNGRVSTSSWDSGVMNWRDDEGQYVKSYCGRETKLGQLVSVSFELDDELKKVLNK